MLMLKECPRCRGDLCLNSDTYGFYTECIQCGYMKDIETDPRSRRLDTRKAEKQAA